MAISLAIFIRLPAAVVIFVLVVVLVALIVVGVIDRLEPSGKVASERRHVHDLSLHVVRRHRAVFEQIVVLVREPVDHQRQSRPRRHVDELVGVPNFRLQQPDVPDSCGPLSFPSFSQKMLQPCGFLCVLPRPLELQC